MKPAERLTILLVEDETSLRSVMERILRTAGYLVHAAATPEEALRTAARSDYALGLLITDITLPGISGYEVAKQVRQSHPDLPVIFTTGYEFDGGPVTAPEDLPGVCLQKPFSREVLLGTVGALLGG